MNNRIGPFVVSTEHRVPDSQPLLIDGLVAEVRKKLAEDIARIVISKRGEFHLVPQLTEPEISLFRDILDEWGQTDLRRYIDAYLAHIKRQVEAASASVVI